MNKMYGDDEYGITPKERNYQIRQLMVLIIVYMCYITAIGIAMEEIIHS